MDRVRNNDKRMWKHTILALALVVSLGSCAILRTGQYASSVFLRESDPELAAAALPTMMKASEALMLADPGHEGKALTTASLYVMYANAFLDSRAFLLPDEAFEQKLALSRRAGALYLRAAAILLPFIEARTPGLLKPDGHKNGAGQAPSLSRFGRRDVPLLYWTSAAILAAFASDPMNFDNAARVSAALALFEKARALEPDWNGGSLHELAITIYGSLPADLGGDSQKAAAAFEAAIKASGGSSPGAYVAWASSICTRSGDRDGFRAALETALSLAERPESALLDVLARSKAQRLLDDIALYF